MQSKTTDMTTGNPAKLILLFAMPLLAGNFLQQLYNMVDSLVVGRFVGTTALAAVGTAFPVVFLLSSLFRSRRHGYGQPVLRRRRQRASVRHH
ncbi:MAG: MATE family efflux transporter [Ruthenibacterium sp.]